MQRAGVEGDGREGVVFGEVVGVDIFEAMKRGMDGCGKTVGL
jgi:hypothetical protein